MHKYETLPPQNFLGLDEEHSSYAGSAALILPIPYEGTVSYGQGTREGLGACTGDSGAPVFEDKPGGPAIVGVVSWSTGPNGSDGCGGMTGVTPLTLYRDWLLQTARQWGAAL